MLFRNATADFGAAADLAAAVGSGFVAAVGVATGALRVAVATGLVGVGTDGSATAVGDSADLRLGGTLVAVAAGAAAGFATVGGPTVDAGGGVHATRPATSAATNRRFTLSTLPVRLRVSYASAPDEVRVHQPGHEAVEWVADQ